MSASPSDSYENLDCHSFLTTIAARGIDIRGSPVYQKAFMKSVIITTTLFVDRLYRLRFVGYMKTRSSCPSPKKFAHSLLRHKSDIDIHGPTLQHFTKAKAICKGISEYKAFLNGQHAGMIALHDALRNRLLQARATKTFIPFEQSGVHFTDEKKLREEVERLRKYRKNDDFIMGLISPVQGHELPQVSKIVKTIPFSDYKWETTEDCDTFLSNLPPKLLENIHLDDITYAAFFHSVATSMAHVNQAIEDTKVISGHVGQKTKFLPITEAAEFDMDTLKQACDLVVKERMRLVILCDKFRQIVTSLETIVRTRQTHAPFPQISILPKDSNDVMLKLLSRKLRDLYMDVSTTYNRQVPEERLLFAEKSLRKLRPLLAHDEAVINRML